MRAGPTIGASGAAPSQPLLDLSMHRVVSAQDLLCDNSIGRESARNPAARHDVNAQ
jgi:hypothetical protein